MQHWRDKSTRTTLRYPGPLGTHCKLHRFLAVWPLRKVSYHPTMSRNLLKSTTTHPHYTTFSNWWFPKNADGKSVSVPSPNCSHSWVFASAVALTTFHWVCQQDNDSKENLFKTPSKLLEWSFQSLKLNPIENSGLHIKVSSVPGNQPI